jgi:hypothetical protein
MQDGGYDAFAVDDAYNEKLARGRGVHANLRPLLNSSSDVAWVLIDRFVDGTLDRRIQ